MISGMSNSSKPRIFDTVRSQSGPLQERGGGGTQLYFDGVCGPRSETLPIFKDFLPLKMADLTVFGFVYVLFCFVFFLQNFDESGPISKGFSASKMADFTVFGFVYVFFFFFLQNFGESGPISKGFSASQMADFTILCQF